MDTRYPKLERAPTATFVCLARELEPDPGGVLLAGERFTGAALEFARDGDGRFVATRYEDGRPAGQFDVAELFPDRPPPARVVSHEAGVDGGDGVPYDGDAHWLAWLYGRPFDGLLVDREQTTPFVTLRLFSDGVPLETREIDRTGVLRHLEFRTPEGWDVAYGWHGDAAPLEFSVREGSPRIHVESRLPGRLTTSRFDLDEALFARLLESDAFRTGFPANPADLDGAPLESILEVLGEFRLAERLRSLTGNPDLGGVERLRVQLPDDSAFELLEDVVLRAGPDALELVGSNDRYRRFERWFRERNGDSQTMNPL